MEAVLKDLTIIIMKIKSFGAEIMLKNKIPPPIVTLVFAALIFFSTELTPDIVFSGQNLISLFFMIAGLIVLLIAISAFIKFKTTINPLKPEQASSLVMTGIFNLVETQCIWVCYCLYLVYGSKPVLF